MKPEILLVKPIYGPVQAEIEDEFTVRKLWEAQDAQRFLRDACTGVRAVVTAGVTGISREEMDALPKLELIACFGNFRVGPIDLEAAVARGIVVASTPDEITGAVAELAAGMTLALARRICEGDRFVRAGRWLSSAPAAGRSLVGKTCGIIGLGRIGRGTANRLTAFGMSIGYHGRRPREGVAYRYYPDLVELAAACDVLVVACPLTRETEGLVNARVLDALGPEGFLVNVARGPIVDEGALIAALKEKRIGGAALDVYWDEPQVPAALAAMENVVLLPHVGSTTQEIRDERARKLMANLTAHFAGQPVPHPVTG